mgnify:CR=1 FL=1
MERKRVPLGNYITEYSVRNRSGEDIPVYSVTNSQGFCTEYFDKEVASKDKTTYKIVPRGYFAYNPSRINVGSVDWQRCEGRVIVSPLYNVFSVSEKMEQQYLFYFLKSNVGRQMIKAKASGSVRDNLKMDMLKEMTIPERTIEEQKKCVATLDALKTIISLWEKELEKLDELIKARFVEMFGTLDNPSQEFAKATLKELCNKITDGKHGGCKAEEGTERYFVGAREIYDDEVHYNTAPEINIDEFEKDYKRCNIEIGDFLIVNTGATIGKSAIATDERTEHTLLQKSVALLKVKKEVLNPVFLKWCYRVNTQMYIVKSASAQPNLLLSKINATVIYVPNIELQNQFVSFVEQVDKSKVIDINIILKGGVYNGNEFFVS